MTPYLAPAWAYGSVPAAVWDLARAQAACGTSVDILTTDALAPHERQPVGSFVIDGVHVIRVRNVSGLIQTWLEASTPFGFARRTREAFSSATPDIVHLHELLTVENWRVVGNVPPGVPVVCSTHGVWHERHARKWFTRLQERMLRPALQRLDHVVVQSDGERRRLREMWSRQGLALENERVSIVQADADVTGIEIDFRHVYGRATSRHTDSKRSR